MIRPEPPSPRRNSIPFTERAPATDVLAADVGALGADVLGMDPSFPLKFMIYFLIVVAVGGTSSITGPLLAALLLGIADVAGKYYIPKLGAFIVYSLMIVILVWRPQGLFVRKGGKA
jgi:branched-chain amino acid transport system permease protein